MKKLEKLINNRDSILLAEIGALIHVLGKLSEEFVKKQSLKEKDNYSDFHHSNIVNYDSGEDKKIFPKRKNFYLIKRFWMGLY